MGTVEVEQAAVLDLGLIEIDCGDRVVGKRRVGERCRRLLEHRMESETGSHRRSRRD
jgi:hypothetical protein